MAPATRTNRLRRCRHLCAVLLGLAAAGVGLWVTRRGAHSQQIESAVTAETPDAAALAVQMVRPRHGGIPRTIQQPASINSFETVDLFAMVSGYLKTQSVDIGSRIKKGQLLAEISVPRDEKAVAEAASLVEQARAQVEQAQARIKVTQAQQDAAAAAVKSTESDLDGLVARRELALKQYQRVSGLVAQKAATSLLADEQQLNLEVMTAAERSGHLEIDSARAKLLAARAAVEQSQADAAEARANLGVAVAHLDRAKVNLDYARIVAPFDGVVTLRTFHPGALIRSAADSGQQQPLLTVKRIDLMRVVVLVPDRDVVLTRQGDPVVVTVDALGGRSFQGTLARIARAEDAERLMHVEIDLPNPENVLCDGMYGKATITLERNARSLTLPAACVLEHSGRSGGVVFVDREGVARRTDVRLGGDNGSEVEIISGISPDNSIVVPDGKPLEDGMRVIAAAQATPESTAQVLKPPL
jgi:HlyD family secretion protein